ncbi:hypothetical protein MMC20_005483 [Loxospora ochrophaea]|nr:hypothetical protein [Loxospora ochrophaea]
MASESDNTSLIALVVALIALLIATGQLLQQIFGTAEGYRRCQSSVIGLWSKKTRLRWRWSQFRFETMFVTPNIMLYPLGLAYNHHQASRPLTVEFELEYGEQAAWITGSDISRDATMTPVTSRRRKSPRESSELVAWITLLDQLHYMQSFVYGTFESENFAGISPAKSYSSFSIANPAITYDERSWDFMPPEIVRPIASSTLGDVLVLAHRLGMGWRDVRPGEGILRAEGNGHTLTSSLVRGFGILFQYTFDHAIKRKKDRIPWKNLYIPSEAADKLAFGIVSRCFGLDMPDLIVSSEEEPLKTAIKAMEIIGVSGEAMTKLREFSAEQSYLPGFNDVLGMWAPWLPIEESSITQIMSPGLDTHSPTIFYEGRVVFRYRLKEYLTQPAVHSDQLRWLLDAITELQSLCPHWDDDHRNRPTVNQHSLAFRNAAREKFNLTTRYFLDLQFRKPSLKYRHLVAAHISMAAFCPDDAAKKKFRSSTAPRTYADGLRHLMSPHRSDTTHLYFDRIERIVDFMLVRGFSDAELVTEAWWTLFFRALCWHLSVDIIELGFSSEDRNGVLLPAQLWGSQIPVYIA